MSIEELVWDSISNSTANSDLNPVLDIIWIFGRGLVLEFVSNIVGTNIPTSLNDYEFK